MRASEQIIIFGGRPLAYSFQNAEAAALVARFAVQPDNTRKALIDGQFTAGKAKSFWAKLDALWAHAAHASDAARLNWLGSVYDCLTVNNPVFTVDRGYMGNGSSSYLDTQFNPTTAVSPHYTQDSGAVGIRSNTDNTGTGSLAGFFDTTNQRGTTINPRVDSTNNQAAYRANQGSTAVNSSAQTSTSSIGMFVANRVGASDIRGYREGVSIAAGITASTVLANGNIRLGSINATSFRACQFSMGYIAGGLTDQEVQDIYNWFEPYRIAVGVT